LGQYDNIAGRSVVAGVLWNDMALGKVYTYLQELGKLDDTIFVVTSDHGPGKNVLYEQGVRTFCFVRYPRDGAIFAGVTVASPVSNLDLLPSLFALAGVEGDYDTDGESWASLVSSEAVAAAGSTTTAAATDRFIFLEADYERAVIHAEPHSSTGTFGSYYKYLHAAQAPYASTAKAGVTGCYAMSGVEYQLFELQEDEGEQINVIDEDPASNAVALAEALAAHKTSTTSVCCADGPPMALYLATSTGMPIDAPTDAPTDASTLQVCDEEECRMQLQEQCSGLSAQCSAALSTGGYHKSSTSYY
jgi:hypothetical protein